MVLVSFIFSGAFQPHTMSYVIFWCDFWSKLHSHLKDSSPPYFCICRSNTHFPSSALWLLTGWCPGSRGTIFTTLHPHSGKSSSGPVVEQVGGWANRLQENFGEQIYGSSPFIIECPEDLQRRSSVDEWGGKGLVRGPASKVNFMGLLN